MNFIKNIFSSKKSPESLTPDKFLQGKSEILEGIKSGEEKLTGLIDKSNKNINSQMDELYSLLSEVSEGLQNDDEVSAFKEKEAAYVEALIKVNDLIEDFYAYALSQRGSNENLFEQASLMWKSGCKSLAMAGILRVEDEGSLYDPKFSTAYDVERDSSKGDNIVTRVLRSGYIKDNKLLRKSTVIVNKKP